MTFTARILLLGSGELGKEFAISAKRLGAYVIACDSYAGAPAMQVADGLGLVILGIEVLTVWLNDTAEPKPSRYLLTPLIVVLVLLVWTAIWSVLSRIFTGQAKLERNLLIALGGALVYSLWNEFVWLYSFAFASRALVAYGGAVFWLILGAISFLHLRGVSPARSWAKAGGVLLLAGAGFGTQMLTASEGPSGSPYQGAPRRLLPPAFRVAPLVDRDAFAAELAKLKPKLDTQREAESGDATDSDDEEGSASFTSASAGSAVAPAWPVAVQSTRRTCIQPRSGGSWAFSGESF